jgi:6-phosphofructokinase 1
MPKNSLTTIDEDSLYLIDEVGSNAEIETAIEALGDPSVQSPLLKKNYTCFVSDKDRVVVRVSYNSLKKTFEEGSEPLSFELAGPRQKIYFDPSKVRSAVVTCG